MASIFSWLLTLLQIPQNLARGHGRPHRGPRRDADPLGVRAAVRPGHRHPARGDHPRAGAGPAGGPVRHRPAAHRDDDRAEPDGRPGHATGGRRAVRHDIGRAAPARASSRAQSCHCWPPNWSCCWPWFSASPLSTTVPNWFGYTHGPRLPFPTPVNPATESSP